MNYLIKPCPFCGLQMGNTETEDYLKTFKAAGMRIWEIKCLWIYGGCGTVVIDDTRDGVIKRWNKRVNP